MKSSKLSEKCILRILNSRSQSFTTIQLLDETRNYPELCSSCKSQSNIIAAALRLWRNGRIERTISKGGFVWKTK